jgi:putative transposase
MPRPNRLVLPGVPHHITQRGNYCQKVFFRAADRLFYLQLLAEFLPHYGVALEGYCLMDNHVHLIAIPHDGKGLSRALQRIQSDYSRATHLRLRRMGHLWQARFHSTPLTEEKHSWDALLYVERNPVRAGLVEQCRQWPWSSTQTHLGLVENPLLDLVRWRARFDASRWERYLQDGSGAAAIEDRIREATLQGRFAADSSLGAPRKPVQHQNRTRAIKQATVGQ